MKNKEELHAAKTLSENFQKVFIDAAAQNGIHIDKTASLEHLYRLPGTINHKNGNRKAVQLFDVNESVRYKISDFEKFINSNKKAQPLALVKADEAIPAGKRNSILISMAGFMLKAGLSPEAIKSSLEHINRTSCCPPLSEAEISGIAKSAERYRHNTLLPQDFKLTEAAVSDLLVQNNTPNIIYCAKWKQWMLWNGKRFLPDDKQQIIRYTLVTVKHLGQIGFLNNNRDLSSFV